MNATFLHHVLQAAETLARTDQGPAPDDVTLWQRFTEQQDESAFALLVRRHGALVWGVCRNLLASDADAEDAFQATFLAFLRSAKSVKKPQALGSWLHGVAYRVALKARRTKARRLSREGEAAVPEASQPVADAAWFELHRAVHEEVHRLPETLRTPFVLCCLEGASQQTVAVQLGWKIGTLSGRLCKARKMLLERLTQRGLTLSVAATSATLTMFTTSSAPAALLDRTVHLFGMTNVPSTLVYLARGATSMYFTRTKWAIAAALMLGLLTTSIGTGLFSKADAQSNPIGVAPAKVASSPKMFWEYKLVPQDKTYSSKEFLAVLSDMEAKGSWEYCGTQAIAEDGKTSPKTHLVFKRRIAIVNSDAAANAQLDLRAEAELLRAHEQDLYRKLAVDKQRHLADAMAAKIAADDRAQAISLLQIDLKKAEAEVNVLKAEMEGLVRQRAILAEVATKTRAEAEKLKIQNDLLNVESQLNASRAKVEVGEVMVLRVRKQIENMKPATPAIPSIDSQNGVAGGGDATSGTPPVINPMITPAPKSNVGSGTASKTVPANEPAIQIIRLKHAEVEPLATILKEVITQAGKEPITIAVDTRTNSLILKGSEADLQMAKKLVEQLDTEPRME